MLHALIPPHVRLESLTYGGYVTRSFRVSLPCGDRRTAPGRCGVDCVQFQLSPDRSNGWPGPERVEAERWSIMLRRSFGTCGLVLAVMASVAYAQPGGGPGGPGGRGGMFGGGFNMMATPGAEVYLLAGPDVQKELAITDDQKTKASDLCRKPGTICGRKCSRCSKAGRTSAT